ncbi:MAG: nucleoside phosphorylase [Syntrophobacter sp.]
MRQDKDSCLIEPRRGRKEDPLPHSAILVFNPEDLRTFQDCFTHPVSKSHKIALADVFTGEFNGSPIALAGPMLGAPQTILVLERIIALGARQVIASGWCGSLQTHVGIGDIVLPVAAISEEGTSRHYPEDTAAPSLHLMQTLRQALGPSDRPIHEGTVWTTDAPFRETVTKVERYQSEGVLAVEMETSALFTVARFRGIDLAVVLVVSDDLSNFKWRHGFREPVFRESRRKVARLTLDASSSAAASLSHS